MRHTGTKVVDAYLISRKDGFKQPFEFSSVAFKYVASNAHTISLESLGVEDGMEHHEQALLALSISSGLCLAAWIWARRRLSSLRASVDQDVK